VIALTLRGLAKKLNLPYSTTRKYLLVLQEAGIIKLREGPIGLMIEEREEEALKELLSLLKTGYTIEGALKRMKGERVLDETEILKRLDRIEQTLEELKERVEELKKEKAYKKGWFWRLFKRE